MNYSRRLRLDQYPQANPPIHLIQSLVPQHVQHEEDHRRAERWEYHTMKDRQVIDFNPLGKKFELTEEQKQEIREAFDLFDTDGSGIPFTSYEDPF